MKKILLLLLTLFVYTQTPSLYAAEKKFTVTIDAGHGGKDKGALGAKSVEKDINLSTALALGALITKNNPTVDVIYTRTTDVFVELYQRAEKANRAKSDLFISIHANSTKTNRTSARGTETFTYGFSKSKESEETAKTENAVIYFESDYQTRYLNLDPNSTESQIISDLIENKNREQSVKLAKLIQKEFKFYSGRIDRGVKQANFMVLRKAEMPCILIELGFICNVAEENYMISKAGSGSLCQSIYNAFYTYYSEQKAKIDATSGVTQTAISKTKNESPPTVEDDEFPSEELDTEAISEQRSKYQPTPKKTTIAKKATPSKSVKSTGASKTSKPVFKVQFLVSTKKLQKGDPKLKGIQASEVIKVGNTYKFMYRSTTNYNQILLDRKKIKATFPDAFIVAYKEGKQVDIQQAISEFKQKK